MTAPLTTPRIRPAKWFNPLMIGASDTIANMILTIHIRRYATIKVTMTDSILIRNPDISSAR